MLVLVATKLPVAVVGLAAGLFPVAVTGWLLIFGVRGIGHLGDRFYVGPWALGPLTGLLLCALALAAGILAIAALEGLRTLLASLSRSLLSPGERTEGPVREMLAESLGDRTLSVAYWLPERQIFVDEAGHMVRLPEPGSGRAWTAVERDGRRVAAIIHDAELDTGPELVNAAAAGAALAIDNERLKADLRARVEELRVSRVRIVEAGDHARRRIERDLHDGAQQQLVSLSLDLRLLKAKLNGNEAAAATGRRAVGEARHRARRAARARPRHPPRDPHRARARARRRRARPARAGPGRGRHLDPRAPDARDRGRRLLRGRRGAHQRRQVRAGRATCSSTCAATSST